METLLQIFPKYTPPKFCHFLRFMVIYLYYHNTRTLRNMFKIQENLRESAYSDFAWHISQSAYLHWHCNS